MGCIHCCVYYSLEATEEKFRNRESRPEDLQVIAELKDMVSERETLVKKLVVGGRQKASWHVQLITFPFFVELLLKKEASVSHGSRITADTAPSVM